MVMKTEALANLSGIDNKTIVAIRNLSKRNIGTEKDPTLVKSIQDTLASLIGNMDINKKLSKIQALSKEDSDINTLDIADLKDLSFRTRHLKEIQPDLEKIFENFERANSTDKLEEKDKITLKQFGFLYDLAYLVRILEKYNQLNLIRENKELDKLFNNALRAQTIVGHLDNSFNRTFTIPTGAVVFDHTRSKAKIYGKELGFFELIIAFFITKFGHVSKGMTSEKDTEKENKISHINPAYKEEKFTLRNYLYSDMYKIKLDNLIDPETKKLLTEKLGANWLTQLEQKYAQIERDIHDDSRVKHAHIIADGGKLRQASLAISPLLGGHKNFFMKDHNNADIRDDIFGRNRWRSEGNRQESRILCSEFVGKTIIASIQELNDQIKKELQTKECAQKDIPDILINSPISEKEKLYLLTPQRLLDAMQERGAVEAVEKPESVHQLVNQYVKTTDRIGHFFKERIVKIKKENSTALIDTEQKQLA